jgi:dTMP kinase
VRVLTIEKYKFFSFEGIDGSGKGTQIKLYEDYLKSKGYTVQVFRDPGGTAISEKIRSILLSVDHKEMNATTELLLYTAARTQLVFEKILPALAFGHIVLIDRYIDSTFAYQYYGRKNNKKLINYIVDMVQLKPYMTFLFDLPVRTAMQRLHGTKDRLELESYDFFERVRQGYLKVADKEPDRVKVISATKHIRDVSESVIQYGGL